MRSRTRPHLPAGRFPLPLVVPAALAVTFLLLPLAGILARTPWSSLPARLASPAVKEALSLSLTVSTGALALSLVLGVPLAWLLARTHFRGKALVRCLVLLPMVLPPTVAGVALLQGYGRQGVAGQLLDAWLGVSLPFTTGGAVLAATFVAMPFLVISLEGTLSALDARYEETATSLGASPLRVFRTITLPMTAPGLVAGAALCWARALGEFGATITFAGNLPGETQTLPLQVYLLLQDDPEGATALSLVLLAAATAVLVLLRGNWTGRRPVRTPRPAPPDPTDPAGPTPPEPAAPPPAHPHPTPQPLRTTVTGAVTAALDAAPGTTIAVVGPNGAGKSTLLRALLGLTDRATTPATAPPHRRRAAWVPQDGALFPHLTAVANTAYGLRAQGVPKARAHATARQWLESLGIGPDLAGRRPGRLSGGQAQRVALARALAAGPRLLLLDEPLTALDQTTRAHVRHTLRTHLAAFPGVCLMVTHDPVEAVSLADHVLVLEDGRVTQYATPAELTRRPRSPWVARMLGDNAWEAEAAGDGTLALTTGATLRTADAPAGAAPGLAVVPPHAVSLHATAPKGAGARTVWHGTVREITAQGGRLRTLVAAEPHGTPLVAELTPAAAAGLGLTEGATVWASIKTTEVRFVTL
ncbi:hypothetical protein GCM10010218_57420 [Streptomyces mashuensis]|uniref:Molybdate ABC transporter permease subunit n=1 Tax=Streptomyces mashuensis TaxID=33904 RepID=A0A919B804_9ACTN|nr:ABC transporter permease [Streptomyces mashuensis]GHF68521.1 hypothetical protein GCM10010218_57420 [Streptomyces mashuensis]